MPYICRYNFQVFNISSTEVIVGGTDFMSERQGWKYAGIDGTYGGVCRIRDFFATEGNGI